mgnify:CR=1 FL=1
MSAIKQSHVPQQPFYYQQQQTVDLTQQERNALSLVWNDDTAAAKHAGQQEVDTAHCAVLGYN